MISQKYAKIKKITERSSNFNFKFCPMLVETPYSGGVINPKTYLNHAFDSHYFFSLIVWYIN